MNVNYFIAKKLFTAKEKNNSYTKPIFSIAILAIALSVAVMLISVIVIDGFKKDISDKVIGFGSHITISKFTDNQSYESEQIDVNQDFYVSTINDSRVNSVNVFATKAGIIRTNEEIHGVVLKGLSSDYDWSFFHNHLVYGEVIKINDSIKSNEILISEQVSRLLNVHVSDDLVMYFIQNPARVRKFKIKGIYNTAMADFDNLYVLGDIKQIQALNSWKENKIGGFEIKINDFNELDEVIQSIYNKLPYNLDAKSIKDRMPQIFEWLELQDVNVRVILVLMIIVGIINMITALLILILDRTRMIGILKALGAKSSSVRKVFLYVALNLVLKGLLLGNIIAFSFSFLQKHFSFISLNPETYFMNTVPISFDFSYILLLNIGTIVVCYLVLIIPSLIITKITPIKAIRFE